MRIGYLHVGQPEQGPVRYGRLLADAARSRSDVFVLEAGLELGSAARRNRERLADAGRRLGAADVVHLQYNCHRDRSIWGAGWQQLHNLATFARHCAAPLVVTLHDIYPPTHLRAVWQRGQLRLRELGRGGRGATLPVPLAGAAPPDGSARGPTVWRALSRIKRALQPDVVTAWWLHRQVECCLVCSDEERRRFDAFLGGARLQVVPHFVEARACRGDHHAAKCALQLEGVRTVTLLGFIHPRKGHRLLVEAMSDLPPDVMVIFAGAADADHAWFTDELRTTAKRLGMAQRVRVTGRLTEAELEQYLLATDVAVCPFRTASASGSLATWISSGAAVLASDLPLVAEYNGLEPGAIDTFAPYSAAALAEGVRRALGRSGARPSDAMRRLRDRLLLPAVFDHHLAVYRAIAAPTAGSRRQQRPVLTAPGPADLHLALAPDEDACVRH